LWGLLAVGLFASGLAGAGWNGVGEAVYLDVAGQGVSGYVVAQGLSRDWPGQFQAQAFGVAAVVCVALLVSGLLVGWARSVVRAWHGEATPRQKARPARSKRSRRATRRRVPWGAWRWPRVGRLVPAWLRTRNAALDHEDEVGEAGGWPESAGLESFDLSGAETSEGEALIEVDAPAEVDAPVETENPPDGDVR